MKLLSSALLLCLGLEVAAAQGNQPAPDFYPEFTWDSVPVTLHFSKRSDFTPTELEFIARFPLTCIEKHQGYNTYKDVRKGAYVAAEQIRAINPRAKVLFYWNSRIDTGASYFGANILDEEHPEWAQVGTDGKLILTRGVQKNFEPAIPELRKWWVSIPQTAVEQGGMDGVFIDAIQQHIIKPAARLGEENFEKSMVGLDLMLKDLNSKMEGKIVVFNNMNPTSDYDSGLSKYANGGMIEHFCYRDSDTPDDMVKQIETVQEAARQGRVMMVKCWPRYYFRRSDEFKGISAAQIEADIKEDIEYPLACFLIAAGRYSYFCYSYGYSEKHGSMIDFPEYHKPLGEPTGEARRDGYKFSRTFKHADVWIDLEARTGGINWR
ncbi:MAG: putative glycoside hydrolase [Rikenellaceae bacterium]